MTQYTQVHRLVEMMEKLRDKEHGCPWDLKQDFNSIMPYTIEEVYELAEAIDLQQADAIKNELGDLFFQIIFYAQMAKEKDWFDLEQIAKTVADKMIHRHPHVFAEQSCANVQELEQIWRQKKSEEKTQQTSSKSLMSQVSNALPAFTNAYKSQKQAASVGFDWSNTEDVLAKLHEEIAELEQEMTEQAVFARIEDELGDVLFSCVNLARHLHCDAETALRKSTRKFKQRFEQMEKHLNYDHPLMQGLSVAELESLWQVAKK